MSEKERYFEDIDIGDDIGPLVRVPTMEQVVSYVNVWGIGSGVGSRFTDEEVAKREGLGSTIIPGNMTMGFVSQMLTDWVTLGELRSLEVTYKGMVRPGDTLTCKGIVVETRSENGENFLECDVFVENQKGEKPLVGRAVLALPSKKS
ncbi:MAG: MaoC family dehydratase [Candidatus Tectomicrobia bacterium]|nr:MaoC family dehydratase [Candidatus Tectomicrobia bacterium]